MTEMDSLTAGSGTDTPSPESLGQSLKDCHKASAASPSHAANRSQDTHEPELLPVVTVTAAQLHLGVGWQFTLCAHFSCTASPCSRSAMAEGIPTPQHCQSHKAAEPPPHPTAPSPCVPGAEGRARPPDLTSWASGWCQAGEESRQRRLDQGRAWLVPLAAWERDPYPCTTALLPHLGPAPLSAPPCLLHKERAGQEPGALLGGCPS